MDAIVTIGNFDGVHLGHRMLFRQVCDRARVLGLRSFAVTFDPHPEQVLFPERHTTILTTAQERAALIRAEGIDDIWVCAFTPELARLEPQEFMRLLMDRQPIAELWVGHDFALGRGRAGTISVLAEIGGAYGWALHVVPPYRLDGQVVSSTAVRTLLAAGAVEAAAELLGRPYSLPGNLTPDGVLNVAPDRVLPKPGAYAVQLDASTEATLTISSSDSKLQLSGRQLRPGPITITFVRASPKRKIQAPRLQTRDAH